MGFVSLVMFVSVSAGDLYCVIEKDPNCWDVCVAICLRFEIVERQRPLVGRHCIVQASGGLGRVQMGCRLGGGIVSMDSPLWTHG